MTLRKYLNKSTNNSPITEDNNENSKIEDNNENSKIEDNRIDNTNSNRPIRKYIGAHVSIKGGLASVFDRMDEIEGKAVAMFLKNQKTFYNPPLSTASINSFINRSGKNIDYVLPHASYLINLAQPDKDKRERGYNNLLDDLIKCDQLGIPLLNFHPGSNVGKLPIPQACKLISDCLNRCISSTKNVIVVIENMAGQGNVLGCTFEQIKLIIDGVTDKSRVGVCLDTCHLFGAGYDIRTEESFSKVLSQFDKIVGLKYLKGMHLNDSKEPLGSKKDRHESIGKGLIGLEAFRYIMNNNAFDNIPLILETPDSSKYKQEIDLLYSLIK
ncbi:deoxyribonuclease IV [Nematocida sp. AWRm80]|nr:deoxyribonuclease IV [Nematocida sp. AWRm80]